MMASSGESDSVQQLEAFCAELKGSRLSGVERARLRGFLRTAVLDTVTALKRLVEEEGG
jgi:hypothetical protein